MTNYWRLESSTNTITTFISITLIEFKINDSTINQTNNDFEILFQHGFFIFLNNSMRNIQSFSTLIKSLANEEIKNDVN